MSPATIARAVGRQVTAPSPTELWTHAAIVVVVVICATILGVAHDLNSGDLLAVFTGAITGTAAVAGARSTQRRVRATDPLPEASDA